jgi:hypothetical protein
MLTIVVAISVAVMSLVLCVATHDGVDFAVLAVIKADCTSNSGPSASSKSYKHSVTWTA